MQKNKAIFTQLLKTIKSQQIKHDLGKGKPEKWHKKSNHAKNTDQLILKQSTRAEKKKNKRSKEQIRQQPITPSQTSIRFLKYGEKKKRYKNGNP